MRAPLRARGLVRRRRRAIPLTRTRAARMIRPLFVGGGNRDEECRRPHQPRVDPRVDPLGAGGPPAARRARDRCRSDDENCAKTSCARFRDRAGPLRAAARVLSRHGPEPGRELPSRGDARRIGQGRGAGRRRDEADTGIVFSRLQASMARCRARRSTPRPAMALIPGAQGRRWGVDGPMPGRRSTPRALIRAWIAFNRAAGAPARFAKAERHRRAAAGADLASCPAGPWHPMRRPGRTRRGRQCPRWWCRRPRAEPSA